MTTTCQQCRSPSDGRLGPPRCATCRTLKHLRHHARWVRRAWRLARRDDLEEYALKLAKGASYSLVAKKLGLTVGQISAWAYRREHGSSQAKSPVGHHGCGEHWWKKQKRKGRPRSKHAPLPL